MLEFRKTIDGDAIMPIRDFPMDATYALTAKKGDVVALAGGVVVKAAAAATTILGVFEGLNLRINGETASGKVRVANGALYEADVIGGTPAVGFSYALGVTAGGESSVNVAVTTPPAFKVVSIQPNGKPLVIIHPTARIIG